MFDKLLTLFGDSAFANWGLFGILILCGFGLPIPEDIILVTAGFIASENGQSVWPTIFIMYFGIMCGDLLIYFGGRKLGSKLVNIVVKAENRDKVQALFKKYGTAVIFIGRFLPGLRTPIFFTAGTLHFSAWRFFVMDGFAALISAPLFVYLGHWAAETYAEDIHSLQKQLGRTQTLIMIAGLVLGLIIFYGLWSRARRKKKEELSRESRV